MAVDRVAAAIVTLAGHLGSDRPATKHDLEQLGEKLMSVIGDFAAKQKAHNDRISTAVDGIQTDLKTLQDKIDALQNSAGQITPEDQALLDQIDKAADAAAQKLEALDQLNPPTPPQG